MYYVYRFINENSKIIYVGKTKRIIKQRLDEHFSTSGHLPKECYSQVKKIEYIEILSKVDMDIKELYYINKWIPIYNDKDKYEEEFSIVIDENEKWIEYNRNEFICENIGLNVTEFDPERYKWRQTKKQIEQLHEDKVKLIRNLDYDIKTWAKSLQKKPISLSDYIKYVERLLLMNNYNDRSINYYNLAKKNIHYDLPSILPFSSYDEVDDEIRKEFLKSNIILGKHSIRFRRATPEEFYKQLIGLSKKLNLNNIDKKVVKKFFGNINLDCVLRNNEQDGFLSTKGINIKSQYYYI
jgi:hypothetical protein